MNISEHFKSLNYYLGIKIFKNDNLFTYSLYTYLLNFFLKKRINNKKENELFKNGFLKINKVDKKFKININNEIHKQITDQSGLPILKYEINNNLKSYLKNFLINISKEPINILKNLFKCNVYITTVQIRRTYHINKNEFKNESIYSEDFHCDKYVGTHYKQFIYLNDVDAHNGPFIYMSKDMTKKFVKNFRFKNRFIKDTSKEKLDKFENYFTGEKGSSILVNTTQCLHRAGIPKQGKFRDIIVITYVASPNIKDPDPMYFSKNFEDQFWNKDLDGMFSKKLAKFKNNKEILRNLFKHINQIKEFNDNNYTS